MKKLLIVAVVLLFASQAFAEWTSSPTSGSVIAKNYGNFMYQVAITFTCDGSASGALDLNTMMSVDEFAKINGGFLRSVSVVPGTSSVAPDAAYDVNVYDSAGTKVIDATTTSEATKHTYPTTETVETTMQILGSVPFDIGDIGTTGDQVTLYFNVYKP